MDYADDIAAVDNDQLRLAQTLERIEALCSNLGLHISLVKTKFQDIGVGDPMPNIIANGQTVEGVKDFVYLGSSICSSRGSHSEQMRRIGIAASCMSCLTRVWRQQCVSLVTKMRLYTSLVVPVLLYASEIWMVNKVVLGRL